MSRNLIKAALFTLAAMSVLYYIEKTTDWVGPWSILAVFLASWSLFALLAKKGRSVYWSNVVDLNRYRRNKRKRERRERLNAPENRRTTIYAGCERTKIELMGSLLASDGIECFLHNRHSASVLPFIEGIDLELQVLERDRDRAFQIMKEQGLIADDRD